MPTCSDSQFCPVTGDTHASWLLENNLQTVLEGTKLANLTLGDNPVGTEYKRGQLVEFGGTAVSSNGWGNTWLNEKNATSRAATGLVQNSGSLFWSEGFCKSSILVLRKYVLTSARFRPGLYGRRGILLQDQHNLLRLPRQPDQEDPESDDVGSVHGSRGSESGSTVRNQRIRQYPCVRLISS